MKKVFYLLVCLSINLSACLSVCPSVSLSICLCLSVCLQGENDIDQLCCVLRLLGTPNEEIWPVSE